MDFHATSRNTQKRLKQLGERRQPRKPKLYGATLFPTKEDFLREEEKFFKEPKIENRKIEKNQKLGFSSCVRA